MTVENLEGMAREQLMLRDIFFEIHDFLEAAKVESREYQAGAFSALTILAQQLVTFEIDQSRFARQMPDLDAWFLRGEI